MSQFELESVDRLMEGSADYVNALGRSESFIEEMAEEEDPERWDGQD